MRVCRIRRCHMPKKRNNCIKELNNILVFTNYSYIMRICNILRFVVIELNGTNLTTLRKNSHRGIIPKDQCLSLLTATLKKTKFVIVRLC